MKEATLSDQKPLEPETLLELWSQGKLSTEEALRRIMEHNIQQQRAVDALNITAKNLRADMDDLISQTGIKPKLVA
jgi:hypothetical protein